MKNDLSLRLHKMEDIPVLDIAGDVDEFTCAKLREALRDLLDDGESRIVVNLSGVKYMDSSGLGTLVGGMKRLLDREGGLALSGSNAQIERILSLTGLDRIMRLWEDDTAAAASLRLAGTEI